ncbi:hypothetical protein FisN_9Lh327 [Fistulifera solaris]|uniref:Morc S5 domain-containing protein n=1 Tax=Fistulifera solaris TaxID=1519565 RepID=A0A1Z5KL24_FISSO|nr:hypothetical protein FisN_9Lh327 [Fistulifera solaris]|eukprot:GAX27014.1 hypothetical protein FisN_9Lh327 [Fistulifera solaris]
MMRVNDTTSSDAASSQKRAVVNGIGIFHSWPRNFPNPRDALFDLIDNAVDAAHDHGRIDIAADERGSGVVLLNSCAAPVKPLWKVLELYTSEKQSTGAVGENGIGLKQGVVTLANVAFLISKNHHSKYSLGIVAHCLQSESACWLPSFEFKSQLGTNLEQELLTTLGSHPKLRECVTLYGDSFLDGVRRLSKVMLHMDNAKLGWTQYPHVFCLLLHGLKHGETLVPHERVRELLEKTKADLPKHYLHIPKSILVTVGTSIVHFNYWQTRLVEMTTFDVDVNKSVLMEEDAFWQHPKKAYDPSQYYPIRIYVGFDALRAADETQPSTGSLYIYSRTCGRLIRHSPDARGEINVSNGGTDYCQGLTIILDDRCGQLPLNPTKHDVAFSEHADGVIHRANLYCYINIVTRFYYNYFKESYFFKKKADISEALKEMVPQVRRAIALAYQDYKPISQCHFNTFSNFMRKVGAVKNSKITRMVPFKDVALNKGNDTLVRFTKRDPPGVSVISDASVVSPEPVTSTTRVDTQSKRISRDTNDKEASLAAPSLVERSQYTSPMSDGSFTVKKRPRLLPSEERISEEAMMKRVALLEHEVAQLKRHIVTQKKLENEIVQLKDALARQNEIVARLNARFKDYSQIYTC